MVLLLVHKFLPDFYFDWGEGYVPVYYLEENEIECEFVLAWIHNLLDA